MKQKDPFVYAIIRIDHKLFNNIKYDLDKFGYKDIKPVIPTVSLLQKTYRGQNQYSIIPLLFNYGFLRLRKSLLFNRDFVNDLPKDIIGIYSWMKNLDTLHPRKVKKRVDTMEFFDDYSTVATISRKEVRQLLRVSKNQTIYGIDDIVNLNIGSMVTLRGYPYEGLKATVLEVMPSTRKVLVNISEDIVSINIELDFDNIFYTPYQDFDENILLANGNFEYNEVIKHEDED